MDHLLSDLIHQQPAKVTVYMDDIGVFAKDKEEAISLCREVLKRLIKAKLYCKASKCDFLKSEIKLLGVTINKEGFGLEDTKVTDVRNWPIPTHLKALKGFIGFCNFYRRFLKNFSIIARPLHELDKKGIPWNWGSAQQNAFDKLKELILSEPCLAHADLDKKFRMETDASAYAYGAALSQKQDDGKFHPVGFMSKSMLPAERNYDAYDREALGIVKPLQHWRYWLQGTKKPIKIITDHKNLLAGFNNRPTPSKRHLRWLEILKHFNYEVGYRPGAKNTVANILSRRTDHYPEGEEPAEFNPFPEDKMVPIEQLELSAMDCGLEDKEWSQALEWAYLCMVDSDHTLIKEIKSLVTESDPKGENGRIWVPDKHDLRRRLLELYHNTPITGHLGISGTYELVSRGYYWENMHDYVTKYVTNCQVCIRAKKRNHKLQGVLQPLPIPEGPWQWTESDHIVKLPKSNGFDSIYVIVDRFTKMAHFIPTTEKVSEEDLIDIHLKNVWKLHGLPLIHSTDRHGNFTSKYVQKMFRALGIEQRFSSAYHRQTQGQVENLNGWLETFLHMFCDHRKENWADLLHLAIFAWNNHHHSSLDMTPFYANYGMHPTMTDLPSEGQYDLPKRIQRLLESREQVKRDLLEAQTRQSESFNKHRSQEIIFEPGDKVYLSTKNLVTDEGMKKLSNLRSGPYEVIKKVGDGTYKLQLPAHVKVHLVFNVALLTKWQPDPIDGRSHPEPAPIIVNNEEEYVIEKFFDSNWLGKHFQYKVTYKGYGKEHDEWLFRDDLLEDLGPESLLDYEEDFYRQHPRAKRHTDEVKKRTKGRKSVKK